MIKWKSKSKYLNTFLVSFGFCLVVYQEKFYHSIFYLFLENFMHLYNVSSIYVAFHHTSTRSSQIENIMYNHIQPSTISLQLHLHLPQYMYTRYPHNNQLSPIPLYLHLSCPQLIPLSSSLFFYLTHEVQLVPLTHNSVLATLDGRAWDS